jgi:hypothetical protein
MPLAPRKVEHVKHAKLELSNFRASYQTLPCSFSEKQQILANFAKTCKNWQEFEILFVSLQK